MSVSVHRSDLVDHLIESELKSLLLEREGSAKASVLVVYGISELLKQVGAICR